MFYQVVEEYMMQNHQRELANDLEFRRQLRAPLESKFNKGLHFLAEAGRRLRNLASAFKANTSASFDNETPLDCVAC